MAQNNQYHMASRHSQASNARIHLTNTGTHWYHAHIGGSYMDGFRGPLIVHDTAAPCHGKYDQEVIMTISDWYYTEAPYLVNLYQAQPKDKAKGIEPIPDSTLINGSQNANGFASNLITLDEGHNMTIVEMDQVATVPTVTSAIKITTAQRYVAIVTALPIATRNYGILSPKDPGMFTGDATAYMVYSSSLPLPAQPQVPNLNAINEFNMLPFDQQAILGLVTQEVITNFNSQFIEGLSLRDLTPPSATDPTIYGVNSNTVVFNSTNGIAEIVVNYLDAGAHLFCKNSSFLKFLASTSTATSPKSWPKDLQEHPPPNTHSTGSTPQSPPDATSAWPTPTPTPSSASRPATQASDPLQLQQQNLVIPQNMYDTCAAQGIPIAGNAGGYAVNWYDLKNAPVHLLKNPWSALVTPPKGHKARSLVGRFAGNFNKA
ncbi:uncharacterized protein PAC_12239 [Phialocephala subalpina]|uniref:Plastocyanin-like domain-containing protein n=1 Tax=Phialocephala subalpina TaxID=576137 RepID=A0A1L7XBE7_9HELO|nr:uncharacterized protein PAC_12239 [Phialocephala subalpina]